MTSNQDPAPRLRCNFELKSTVIAISGREVSEFGTVRPRVQIPGPRPVFEFRIARPRELM